MKIPPRVFHRDDNPIDVRPARAFLDVSGIPGDAVRIDAPRAGKDVLQQSGFDAVLSPLDGLQVLALAQCLCPEVPFIALSRTISDRVAGQILTCRATTFLLNFRLSRLSGLPRSGGRAFSHGHLPANQLARFCATRRISTVPAMPIESVCHA